MDTPSKTLVIGPAWVGDMVMAQSLCHYLKTQDPGIEISVVAPANTAPIAKRMPAVHDVIETTFAHGRLHLQARWRMGHALKKRRFSQAFVLPGSLKSALVPFFAAIPLRTGYSGEPRWGLINDCRPKPRHKRDLMVDRFINLARTNPSIPKTAFPAPTLEADRSAPQTIFRRLNKKIKAQPVLALCPGAEFGPAKQWPPASFASLANHATAHGWQIWLMGGPGDQKIANEIMASCQVTTAVINLVGQTTIVEAIDLLASADAVVSNDSGLMHIAAATNTPVVGIFGSSSEQHTPPLGDNATSVFNSIDCRPCFARQCPFGHTRCLSEIRANDVINALSNLLAHSSPQLTI